MQRDIDKFCKNISINSIEATLKKVARGDIRIVVAYIGKHNDYNLDTAGKVAIESKVNTTHRMESSSSRAFTDDNYIVPYTFSSIEYMVD